LTIAAWFFHFFEKAFVRRVNRRIDIRMVRFGRRSGCSDAGCVSELVGASGFCEVHTSLCVRANRRGIQARHTGRRDQRNHHAANGNEDAARTTSHDRDNEDRSRMAEDQRNANACP
jgi:hypothetical protein